MRGKGNPASHQSRLQRFGKLKEFNSHASYLSDYYAVPVEKPLDVRHEPPTHLVNGNVNVGHIPQPTKAIRRHGSDGVNGVGRKADGLNLLQMG